MTAEFTGVVRRRPKLCSSWFINGRASGRSNPPAGSTGVNPRGNSSRAKELPRVSATMRSRTRSSSRPGTAKVSSARAPSMGRPARVNSGRPCHPSSVTGP